MMVVIPVEASAEGDPITAPGTVGLKSKCTPLLVAQAETSADRVAVCPAVNVFAFVDSVTMMVHCASSAPAVRQAASSSRSRGRMRRTGIPVS